MTKVYLIATILFICGCNRTVYPKIQKTEPIENKWLWEWVSSWDSLSKETFNLKDSKPPEILFFDNTHVYSNSQVSTPSGTIFNGPDLYSQKVTWKKQAHQDTLILPDSTVTGIQLMTFAAPKQNGNYFVMPAPNYWKKIGLSNETVSLEEMLNGIFIHEFAHTRQMEGVIDKIISFEKSGTYEYPINDDILQNYFQDDSTYVHKFKNEVKNLYELLEEKDQSELRLKVNEWLNKFTERQKEYLQPISDDLAEIDNVFLTMEGIGQYAMMKFYISDFGGNYSYDDALKATRHNKKWWSQEEGLGLILLYEKLVGTIDWSELYSLKNNTIIDLIEKEKTSINK